MGEIVRYSMVGHRSAVQWPQRCPCCGTDKNLTYSQARVARESASVDIKIRLRTEWYDFPILTCRDHAFSNWLGGKILEKTAVATMFRGVVYMSLFLLVAKVSQCVIGRTTWHATMEDHNSANFVMLWGAIGVFGLLVILWAKLVAKAYVLKLDTDQEVAILHFASEKYAREFKRINIKATSNRLAGSLPFFMRSRFVKIVLILCAIFILSIIGRHH